jgi:hypothetical protein
MPRPCSVDLRERAVSAHRRGGRTLEEVAAEFSASAKTLSPAIQGQVLETLKGQVRIQPDATVRELLKSVVSRASCPRPAVLSS